MYAGAPLLAALIGGAPGPLRRLTLVLGGARSGKSAYAEALVMQRPKPWTYVAVFWKVRLAFERILTGFASADLTARLSFLMATLRSQAISIGLPVTASVLVSKCISAPWGKMEGTRRKCRKSAGKIALSAAGISRN